MPEKGDVGIAIGTIVATLQLEKAEFERDTRTSGNLFTGLAKVAVASAAAAAGAFVAFGVAAAHSAEEQERADARVRRVFGASSADFIKWTQARSIALRVNDDVLEDWGASAVQTFTGVGISVAESTTMTQALMERAGDIAAATGRDFDTVFSALLKGTQGATRGLKDLGIVVTEEEIKARALTMGLYSGKGALDASAKAAAIYQLELERTAALQGTAAERAGQMGEVMKTLPVIIDQVMDAAGTVFLPLANEIMPRVAAAFQSFADWFVEHLPDLRQRVEDVTGAIGTAWEWVSNVVLPPVQTAFGKLSDWLEEHMPAIRIAVDTATQGIGDAWAVVVNDVLPPVETAFNNIKDIVLPPVQTAIEGFRSYIVDTLIPDFQDIAGAVDDWVDKNRPLLDQLKEFAGSVLVGGVRTMVDTLRELGAMPLIVIGLAGAVAILNEIVKSNPIVAAFTIILVALGVLRVAWDTNWMGIREKFAEVVAFVKENADVILPAAFVALVALITTVVVPAFGAWAIAAATAAAATIVAFAPVILLILAIALAFYAVKLAVELFSTVWDNNLFGIRDVANTVFGVMMTILDTFKGAIETVGSVVATVADGIGKAFDTMRRAIEIAFGYVTAPIKNAINAAIGLVNTFIGYWNRVTLGGFHIDFPWGGGWDLPTFRLPYISQIPLLARGARDFAGGLAGVGERGPEMAFLPRGSSVTTAADTQAIVDAARLILEGGAGVREIVGQRIETQVIGMQRGDVAREVDRSLRRASLQWNLGGTTG